MINNKQGKLLIIDDIKTNRTFLSSLVDFEGYEAIEAESGMQGITLLKNNDVSLVLLDYMMPEMNGIETLKIIRSKFSPLDLPVIMVTARDQPEDIVEALKSGANDYITKPIHTAVAIARINTHYTLSQINKESQEREQKFKRLSEISFEGIIIHNNNLIIDVNQTFAGLFQYTVQELIGENINNLFNFDNYENGKPENTEKYNELTGIKRDGTNFPIDMISRSILYNGNQAQVTAVRDMSEKKQYETIYNELQENITKLNTLSSMVPVCSWCKNIRNDKGYWQKLDVFIRENYNASVSNSICPTCSDDIIEKEEIKHEALKIDKESLTVKLNGVNIYMTLGEFNILNYLYEHNTRIISIDELLEKVLNYPPGTGNPDSIRTHIARIRSKINKKEPNHEIIVNIPKSGYKFNNINL